MAAALATVSRAELLDDLLEYGQANIRASTARIGKLIIEASTRPFFWSSESGCAT
jgi:hypothetical protein